MSCPGEGCTVERGQRPGHGRPSKKTSHLRRKFRERLPIGSRPGRSIGATCIVLATTPESPRYYHFYTPRNLAVFAHLWALAGKETDPAVRDALQLLLLSYNASHSTLLTRVVPKKSQKDFVVTGAQSGVLYVSGLPVEKNLLAGVRRKVKTFADAFALTWGSRSEVTVTCRSSTSLALKDDSVDYVFTDPPFGNYIPYAEVNQVNEAWLGRLTERADEAIISAAQKKRADDYGRLMLSIFSEVARVLRPNGWATVVFHASKPAVWEALGNAFGANGLQVETTSVLDKEQVSFKQVVSEGGTRGDAVFLLTPEAFPTETTVSSEETVDSIRRDHPGTGGRRRRPS